MIINKDYELKDLDNKAVVINVQITKKLVHEKVGCSILFLEENKIINDLRINRYIKRLKNTVKKSMVGAATNGMGGSSAFYVVSQAEIISITNLEINTLETKLKITKGNTEEIKKNKSHYKYRLDGFKEDLEYFSDNKFDGKYFSINGQHRGDTIKQDLAGSLNVEKDNTHIEEYAPFKIAGKVIQYDSLHQLRLKLTSTDDSQRIKELHNLSINDCTKIWEDYLSECKIDIIELKNVDSWSSLSKFIWFSNSSTSWSEFEHTFKITKTPFTTFIKSKASDKTDEDSELETMIYTDSGLDLTSGKFKKTMGGFEYLLSILFYTSVNPTYLKKFAFPKETVLLDSLLNTTYTVTKDSLESWYRDLTQLLKVWGKLSKAGEFGKLVKKPGLFITCFYFIQHLKEYRLEKSNETFKPTFDLKNLSEIVKDYLTISYYYMNPMHKSNTTFWETMAGVEILKQTDTEKFGCITSKHDVDDVNLHPEFDKWIKLCKEFERTNQNESILRHFTRDLNGWCNDHSSVVEMINDHLEKSFGEKMDDGNDAEMFNDIKWISTESVTNKKQFLTPSIKRGFSKKKEQLEKTSDVGHDGARSKGGSSKVVNLDIEDREINRKTVNV
tara:strand:- start:570 stop:2411 length:1842 start_codon:yes stop_codon:yes gene_type:complete